MRMARGGCGRWVGLILIASGAGCGPAKPTGPEELEPPEVQPESGMVRYLGRLDHSDPGSPVMSWPGTQVILRFTGSRVGVRLRVDSPGYDKYGGRSLDSYDVFVDGVPTQVSLTEGEADYMIATDLPPGEHEVRLFKRTEAWFGETTFRGFRLEPDAVISQVPAAERRMELVGDSVMVGLGVDGPDENCGFAAPFQNHAAAFGPLAARALGAEFSTVASSGVGVTLNWTADYLPRLAEIYQRTLPGEALPRWHFAEPEPPQVVVISAGATDFMRERPDEAAYLAGFETLLDAIRARRPDALVVVTIGPTLSDEWPEGVPSLTLTRAWVAGIVDRRVARGERLRLLEFPAHEDGSLGFGCDFHPSRATHLLMAQQLVALLRAELGW